MTLPYLVGIIHIEWADPHCMFQINSGLQKLTEREFILIKQAEQISSELGMVKSLLPIYDPSQAG